MKLLTEDKVIRSMLQFIEDCDADMLAYFVGEFFGGTCEFNGEEYEFTPNENYVGAFDNEKENI